jgi:hypothetical protein
LSRLNLQFGQYDPGEYKVNDLLNLISGSRYKSIDEKLPIQAPKNPINNNSAINFQSGILLF